MQKRYGKNILDAGGASTQRRRNHDVNRPGERVQAPGSTARGTAEESESRDIKIPMLTRVPNLAEYGRPLTRYLLFLHEIDTSMILVPHAHDEMIGERVRIEVSMGWITRTGADVRIDISRYRETVSFPPDMTLLASKPECLYDYTIRSVCKLLDYTPSRAGEVAAYNYAAMQEFIRQSRTVDFLRTREVQGTWPADSRK